MTQMGSARFDGDTWDLASSVGLTATMVASARAVASRIPGALINDQFAEPLVRAVGVDYFARLAGGELDFRDLDEAAAKALRRFADAMAIRTRFFDEFFLDATRTGVRQAVILASGLDSRAYRLPWTSEPPCTTVFEVDQPQVIEFKTTTLEGLRAQPTADRRAVAVDLRDDWPAALRQAGFDPTQPTAWIAEGLLGYLPAEAQARLLDQLTEQSAPGSRFATEGLLDINELNEDELRRRMQRQSERWNRHGLEFDMAGLVYFDDRTDARTYLESHGWQTASVSTTDLLAKHGLPPIDDDDAPFGEVIYVSAELKAD
jgi:methyltransferase (TIGR00027 family)